MHPTDFRAPLHRIIVGDSPAMHEVRAFVEDAAEADSTALILGDTGTGKELVARAIHAKSKRQHGSFVAVNCAAVAENMLEAELFGHEKGAFTGAIAERQGRFELADGGTLLLDEIGDMSPAMQASILRALEEDEIYRVGGQKPVRIDIRVIAATNRNLQQAVEEGTFRRDLYHRLNVLGILLPPLRDRLEDIPALARLFARVVGKKQGRTVRLSDGFLALLRARPWDGNVRELHNIIERSVVRTEGDVLEVPVEPLNLAAGWGMTASAVTGFPTLATMERLHIRQALELANGNKSAAARLLEITRPALDRRIAKHKIKLR